MRHRDVPPPRIGGSSSGAYSNKYRPGKHSCTHSSLSQRPAFLYHALAFTGGPGKCKLSAGPSGCPSASVGTSLLPLPPVVPSSLQKTLPSTPTSQEFFRIRCSPSLGALLTFPARHRVQVQHNVGKSRAPKLDHSLDLHGGEDILRGRPQDTQFCFKGH